LMPTVRLVAGQARIAGFDLPAATSPLEEAAMVGNTLGALTDATLAEEALAAIGDHGVVDRIRQGAAAESVGVGAFVASTVRQMLDYAEEAMWLDLLGRMSGSPRPGVVALEAMLTRAFLAPAATGVARRRP
jgi:hypothetical protein